jgi:hypothetical protein
MTINNTPKVFAGGWTHLHTHINTHKYLVHYSGISSHSFGRSYSCSLSKMRLAILKLKPEDLEETIIEKPTTHSRTNG